MISFGFVAAKLVGFRRSHSLPAARRLEAEMCKELKTKLLRLMPQTSNGPTIHQEIQTGTFI